MKKFVRQKLLSKTTRTPVHDAAVLVVGADEQVRQEQTEAESGTRRRPPAIVVREQGQQTLLTGMKPTAEPQQPAGDEGRHVRQQIELENSKLRELTQKLLDENLLLKEKVERSRQSIRVLSAASQPDWKEAQGLVQMLVDENTQLAEHLSAERRQLRLLKNAHADAVRRSAEDVERCRAERAAGDEQLRSMAQERAQLLLQRDINNATNDAGDQSVEVDEQRLALQQCQKALEELKSFYRDQLREVESRLADADAELAQLRRQLASQTRENEEQNISLKEAQKSKRHLQQLLDQLLHIVDTDQQKRNL